MIQLTRLNNQPIVVNSDLIKFVENAPDTVITLVTGGKIVVLEGGDFFLPPLPGGVGAARAFAVALSDPAQIAASSDGAPGSNGNLLNLVDLRDQNIVNGQRPDEFYSNLISRLGNEIAGASFELEAEGLVLRQLRNQRSNISGVSLDEEAVNLIRFQRAFEASARVISVVDELTELAINLGRG